jgi:V/A-type H+/Na+-transporting ATPase subunit I
MNLFTVPMRLLTAVVLESKTEAVVQELLRLGVLDFIHIETLAPEQAQKLLVRTETIDRSTISDIRMRIESLYRQAGFSSSCPNLLQVENLKELDLKKSNQIIDRITNDLQSLREKQKGISQTVIRIDELLQYCREGKLQYLDIRVGSAERGDLDTLQNRLLPYAHIIIPEEDGQDAVILTLRRDGSQITPLFDKFGWMESTQLSHQKAALHRIINGLENKRKTLGDNLEQVKKQVVARIREEETTLESMWCNLRLHELIGEIESNFSHTRHTTIFSGWVPAESSSVLGDAIRKASGGECIIEWIEADKMPRSEVPVAVRDVPLLSPFQKIVDNYSTPEYGTINPTPFVAVSYMAMFGLMFGDAGQGLVIMLLGLLGMRYFSRKFPGIEKPGGMVTPNLCKLMVYLGIASIITGILFGSYFGYEIFPPVWFNYHAAVMGTGHSNGVIQDVYDILGITIWFGIIIIAGGLLLNWINLFKKKDFFHLLLDKNGLIGGWLFGIGIYSAFQFVASGYKQLPQNPLLPFAFGLPILILLFKVPLHRLFLSREGHLVEEKGIGALILESVLEWVVDLLEIFSGFLANTLSFMRVAGLGIAHVSLMAAFFEMSSLVGGGIAGLGVMLLGNILVIALEGLSAGIQSLRLNYYEFFTKYFTGKGLSYNPVALHPHAGRQVKI